MAKGRSLVQGLEPVPGYRLCHLLGRGGWGSVWKATGPDGQPRALKFLPCDSAKAAVQEIRALQAIRQIQHPHLIQIEHIWSIPGNLVIAMEMAEGSLLDLLDVYYSEFQAPMIAEHVCFYLRQAAEALDFLNTRQHHVDDQRVAFRHCDVKPSNLLIQGQMVKLADFSLAIHTTATMWYHRRVGTLSYSAPEVFQGWLSDRTDQYSLAVTYCHLRTGCLPFPDTPENFTTDYVRPEPDLSLLSEGERPVIRRALVPVPQNRWPSCLEMMDRLEKSLNENRVLSRS